MASTRLPGKVLLELAGETVLSHVIKRCQMIEGVDEVCCAIPDASENDPVADEAMARGATVFRGSEDDVLDRYWRAAQATGADVILRVTSDCPLIDPKVCADVLRLRTQRDADFATNNDPPSFPHGLDCEVVTLDVLSRAATEAVDRMDREHVMPWVRRNSEFLRVNLAGPGGEWAKMRWTLDFPEDLEFFQRLFETVSGDDLNASYRHIAELLRQDRERAEATGTSGIESANLNRRDTSRQS